MGYVQKHGGGCTDTVWVLDGIELTDEESTDEVHSKRVHEKELTILKDANDHFIFPAITEEWRKPHGRRHRVSRNKFS